ncbi:FAD-dependent monooxygenase [Actinomadura latina]|uniref:FAD-binding protein n=1 Tax=Actinomadura latina TaxID=163603 RepID=A0A846Z019_9ACTN|nr:FAD-dependent monooxygenase [Actinomadura latina]NKZ03723.1 FAD-binding protein [Actinomadura latina]
MTQTRPADVDVLVVGAGPTGLTAAYEALRHGLTARIIDRKAGRASISKALVVHARTMEAFETMGLAGDVLAAGVPFAALNIQAGRGRPVRVDMRGLPWGDTSYPFWLSIPQYVTEQIIETHLGAAGAKVEWNVWAEHLRDHGGHVETTLRHDSGHTETVRSRWLIGCDGGRSTVRDLAGLTLKRSDAGATFVLADIRTTAPLVQDEGYVHLGREGLLLLVPMPKPGRRRIIAHMPGAVPPAIDTPFLDAMIRSRTGLDIGAHDLTWQSRFNLGHGVADRYRRGRVFLAGDAAHVHSPVGGQGLNTGVQEAHNLLWKIAAADGLDEEAAGRLLDTYETERRTIARGMVHGTARMTKVMTADLGLAHRMRAVLAPRVVGRPSVQARLGRRVGMLDTAYRNRVLSAAGRRMPNPELRDGGRLHQRLGALGHTWVAWVASGEPLPDPADARWRGLPVLPVTRTSLADGQPWPDDAERVVLVRPDRHVAAAGRTPEAVWSALQHHTTCGPPTR